MSPQKMNTTDGWICLIHFYTKALLYMVVSLLGVPYRVRQMTLVLKLYEFLIVRIQQKPILNLPFSFINAHILVSTGI